MHYPNFFLWSIVVGNNIIERVSTYKVLGVFINSDLKWKSHEEYKYLRKHARSSCPYVFLCRTSVKQGSILKVYVSSVRPVLEEPKPPSSSSFTDTSEQ